MIAFGPGTKNPNGWYIRVWPNPGFALSKGTSRLMFRFSGKPRVRVLRRK